MAFRKGIYWFLAFCLISCSLFSLEKRPWFGNVYEFCLEGCYAYSYYRSIDSAKPPLSSTSNDHLLYFDLEFPFSQYWDIDADLQLADTPRQDFSFRSMAVQLRYLWLDDIVGDPLTLVTGLHFRYVSPKSLKDVSSPFHGRVEGQVHFSLGKEFVDYDEWRFRVWFYGALGLANRGSPWIEGDVGAEGNIHDRHKGGVFLQAMHSFGNKTTIGIHNFYGYGRMRQKDIDLGFWYGRQFNEKGTLKLGYTRRLLAKRCPKNVNTFFICYLYPFSF